MSSSAAACHPARLPEPGHVRRRPETTILYQVVQGHWRTFLAETQQHSEQGLPWFVERELERYLDCGILARGFARVRCDACGHDELLAFSCKGRGFCPCCTSRRMCDTAAHLVDRVLPVAPYRQWTLSLPFRLRLRLARDAELLSAVLRIFLLSVFAWQRRAARRSGFTGRGGAVTFVQRFGGLGANLNVHFHSIIPDGLFVHGADGWHLRPLDPPTDEEVAAITRRIVRRVAQLLARREDQEPTSDDALVAVQAAAVQVPMPFTAREPAPVAARRSALVDGFSLHANTHVAAHDRAGLERLLRYAGRGPIALSRMSLGADGRVVFQLKRPAPGGATQITLTPLALLRRLAALVPPPRRHLVRYAGVFAPRSSIRPDIVPSAPPEHVNRPEESPPPVPAASPARRLAWAALLSRVFEEDALRCPRCGGRRRILAFITDADAICRILTHLGLPTRPPSLPPARPPPQPDLEVSNPDFIDT